jgi:hypothetical protein
MCLVPSINPCADDDSRSVYFWCRRPCATILRAGAISRRMSWASNQMYASRMRLVTFNCFVLSHATGNVQLRCVSGIAAANRSHVRQFPNVAYDDYYDIVVDTGEIGVEQLATRVQHLLVQYLRARYGDDTINWCERFWTGDRGRYCLVHSRYEGCNNIMGVEVTWCDIKKLCDSLGTGRFHWNVVSTAMGEEDMKCLKKDSGVHPPSSARRGQSRKCAINCRACTASP